MTCKSITKKAAMASHRNADNKRGWKAAAEDEEEKGRYVY